MKCIVYLFAFLLATGCDAEAQLVSPPLHTSGYQIVDRDGRPVQLLSVNWFGFDEKEFVVGGLDHAPLQTIVDEIRKMGFNSVRLPWANEVLEHDPLIPDYALAANPSLKGKRSMELMDIVIQALTQQHIMVILDNHMSDADWCCNDKDNNGLWYNNAYPEAKWIADWQTIVRRYAGNPLVVGADLRNELRSGAAWGGDNPKLDWHAAAKRGGDAVLAVNSNLLIFVEGPNYSTVFTNIPKLPLVLRTPDRLVYSPHAYSSGGKYSSYEELEKSVGARFGFLLQATPATPIWIGEFGACQKVTCADPSGQWVQWWLRYCREHHLANLSYWPLNGTQSTGTGRSYGKPESYGLLDTTWQHVVAPKMLELIHSVNP
jgi:endoglucanase